MAPLTYLIAHPSAELYGSDRVMLATLEGLLATGAQVVVALPHGGPLVAEIIARGGTAVRCPTLVLRKALLSPLGLVTLVRDSVTALAAGRRLLRRVKPKTVYVSTVTIPIWNVISRLARTPFLVHVHEAEASASSLVRRLLTTPLLLADGIVANSQFSVSVLESTHPGVAARTQVVYNGVVAPAHVSAPSPTQGLNILYVGRLSSRKGVDVLLEAVRLLREDGVDARLAIVGDVFPGYEWFRDQLTGAAARGSLSGSVVFHGFQPDVWSYLDAAEVMVVPSRLDEPFGNTAVEGVLAARPVIVSSTSGLVEASQGYESTQSVTPGDAVQLAAALRRVFHRKEEYFAAAGRDRAVALVRHGLDVYKAAMVDTFRATDIRSR